MIKQIHIPDSDKMFLFRTVLFEKHTPRKNGLILCYKINDVPVYSDSDAEFNSFSVGRMREKENIRNYVISSYEPERLKTDSFIIWHLLQAINNKRKKV